MLSSVGVIGSGTKDFGLVVNKIRKWGGSLFGREPMGLYTYIPIPLAEAVSWSSQHCPKLLYDEAI